MARESGKRRSFVGQLWRDFNDDNCTTQAAALAYYTVFSLPALLFLIVTLVSVLVDPHTVERRLTAEAGGMIGPGAANTIGTMLASAREQTQGGTLKLVLGAVMLVFGATGAFIQLQQALNRAWEVKPSKTGGGIRKFVFKRLMSFGFILAVGFLLLVSLVLSALISGFADSLSTLIGGVPPIVLTIVQNVVSLLVIALLFALIFKVLPDAEVAWRDALVGAVFTAVLFTVGKYLIGLYLGRSQPGSAFGAGSVLAAMLVWIYYSSIIVLLGAEFTQVWATRRGAGIQPSAGAERLAEGPERAAAD